MKTLAEAFVDLAGWLKWARFDDPMDRRGAEEAVQLCLVEASPEERSAISEIARKRAHESTASGQSPEVIRFYRAFAYWTKENPADTLPTTRALAKAFVELARYTEIARFDDSDDAQAAEQRVGWCLCESSKTERAAMCEAASERAAHLRAQGAPPNIIEFYDRFVANLKSEWYSDDVEQ